MSEHADPTVADVAVVREAIGRELIEYDMEIKIIERQLVADTDAAVRQRRRLDDAQARRAAIQRWYDATA